MNNKEFMQGLSKRLNIPVPETENKVQSLIKEITGELQSENGAIAVQGFGVFEVKKRLERISVNPVTQQRMLVPPKLTMSFRPSPKLKDLFK